MVMHFAEVTDSSGAAHVVNLANIDQVKDMGDSTHTVYMAGTTTFVLTAAVFAATLQKFIKRANGVNA